MMESCVVAELVPTATLEKYWILRYVLRTKTLDDGVNENIMSNALPVIATAAHAAVWLAEMSAQRGDHGKPRWAHMAAALWMQDYSG